VASAAEYTVGEAARRAIEEDELIPVERDTEDGIDPSREP
jgi:hypothetical protein